MRHKIAFAFLLFSNAASILFAADRVYFSSIGTREGLPNSSVSAIVQDAKGFLWFGTQGGLVRYDGYSYKTYENVPFEKNVLSHNQVQTLFLDGDFLWIGTYGGLNRLDLRTDRITQYVHDPEDPGSLRADLVSAIARDGSGRLWVGTARGLDRLDEKTGLFERYGYGEQFNPLSDVLIRDLHLDSYGVFWAATSGRGLFVYNREQGTFKDLPDHSDSSRNLPSPFVMSISEDPDGTLWFGTWFGGISRLVDRNTFEFETVMLDDERIYFVAALDGEQVLAGSWGGGLFVYTPAEASVQRYRHEDGSGSIPNDVVYSALMDSNNIYWIGTNGDGIAKSERRDVRYRMFTHDPDNPQTMTAGKVTAVAEDADGFLWIGLYNGGLNVLDPSSGSVRRYWSDNDKPGSLPNDIVNTILIDSYGEIWIATNDGLALYQSTSDSFTVYRPDPEQPHSIADPTVYALTEDPDGNIWIGTFTQGLNMYERASGRFLHFPPDALSDRSPSDSLVYALQFDEAGRMWVGYNNGLDRYENGRFTKYRYDMHNTEGISSNTIRNLYLDSRNRLWLGSVGGGLMQYIPETDSFVHLTRKDGMPDNTIRSILEDENGDLWIGTASGIGIIDGEGGFFRGYSVYNDLKDRDFHTGALRSRDGYLYFGGQNTLYQLNPLERGGDSPVPRLLVSSLWVNGREYKTHEEGFSAAYMEKLELEYKENNFTLSFAGNDFREPGRNMYSFKLEPYDKVWSAPSNNPTVTYTNLGGGQYTLRIRVSDNDGYWNDDALSLPVSISSPPWFSLPAFLFYFMALIGIGYMAASLMDKKLLSAKITELMRVKAELEEANKRLDELSMLDGLTGIPNRRRLNQLYPRLAAEAAREKKPLAVIMLDIDFFKDYNDHYGHLKGDETLIRIAQILSDTVDRATDFVARYGGEEFIAVLSNTDAGGALIVAERMRKAVEQAQIEHAASSIAPHVTISAGTASVVPENGKNAVYLVDAADTALYKAKSLGRNRCL